MLFRPFVGLSSAEGCRLQSPTDTCRFDNLQGLWSSDYAACYLAFDVGQAKITTGKFVSEAFVVQPQQVQDGGVQVMQVNFIACGKVSEFVGRPVPLTSFDAAPGEEHGVSDIVVVTSVRALRDGRSSEFAAPDQQRVIQHAALLQVQDQGGDRLVDLHGVLAMVVSDVPVGIPFVAVRHLQEPNARFGKPPSHQALRAEVPGSIVVESVHRFRGVCFVRQILDFRRRRLHSEGKFERFDATFQIVVWSSSFHVLLVQLLQQVEFPSLLLSGGVTVLDVANASFVGFGAGETNGRAGIVSGQECAAPRVRSTMPQRRADRDETRQILVLAAKSICDPAPHAWANEGVAAGVQLQ